MEYLLEKISGETDIKDVYVVTNAYFYPQFQQWQKGYQSPLNITIFNDGTLSNETRLGVLGDINFALQEGKIQDNLFILAGDTLFEMDFGALTRRFYQKQSSIISVYEENWNVLHRRGIVVADQSGKVIDFQEKPLKPKTNLAAPIAYILTKEVVTNLPKLLGPDYGKEDNLVARIIQNKTVEFHTFHFPARYDLGNIGDFIRADKIFSEKRGQQ